MRLRHALLILSASAGLAGCGRGEHAGTEVQKHLTVAGPRGGIERFARLQGSRRPALAVSATRPVGSDRAEATVTLPASYTGTDLIHLTREALAADLSYRYEERQLLGS